MAVMVEMMVLGPREHESHTIAERTQVVQADLPLSVRAHEGHRH